MYKSLQSQKEKVLEAVVAIKKLKSKNNNGRAMPHQ